MSQFTRFLCQIFDMEIVAVAKNDKYEVCNFQNFANFGTNHKLLEIRTFSNDAAFNQLLEIRMVQFKQKIGQGVFSKVYFL